MRVAWKICILGAISLDKIFIKLCSHLISLDFFCDPLYFSWKNSVTPPAFSWPPYLEENDSPLHCSYDILSKFNRGMAYILSLYHFTKFTMFSNIKQHDRLFFIKTYIYILNYMKTFWKRQIFVLHFLL